MNTFSNQTSFSTISPPLQPGSSIQTQSSMPPSMMQDTIANKMGWPLLNNAVQPQQSSFMASSEQSVVLKTEFVGNKNLNPRATTAGQLLDNLVDINDQTDEQSPGDSVASNSEKSKEDGAGYVCPQRGCWKTFSRKLRLNAHLHLHYGTQPFKCTFPGCGKAFSEKQNLRIHMRIHVDERPFQCP